MSTALSLYTRFEKIPMGKWLFSRLVCLKAPYFGTIRPRFVELRPGHGEIRMRRRRRVQNHLGTVHALAMGNLCELVGGMTLDVSLPRGMRWIPRSMNIEYLKLARTDLVARCSIDTPEPGIKKDLPVTVHVTDAAGVEVVRAVITMYISPKE